MSCIFVILSPHCSVLSISSESSVFDVYTALEAVNSNASFSRCTTSDRRNRLLILCDFDNQRMIIIGIKSTINSINSKCVISPYLPKIQYRAKPTLMPVPPINIHLTICKSIHRASKSLSVSIKYVNKYGKINDTSKYGKLYNASL